MLFNLLSLVLLTLLPCGIVAEPLGVTKPFTRNLNLPLLNPSSVYNATLVSNISDYSALATLLPYGFSVPNSQMYLRLGFGLPRHRLDPMSMGGLIAVIQHAIDEGILRDGEEAFPGLDIIAGRQRFGWTLGDGFYFVVSNVEYTGIYFNWGNLKDVVEGLRLFLIVGERYYATAFNFWDGPGWWWRMQLGSGGFEIDS